MQLAEQVIPTYLKKYIQYGREPQHFGKAEIKIFYFCNLL